MNEFEKRRRAWDRVDKEIQQLREQVEQLEAERDTAMHALESLTPGGSEFAGDTVRCAQYVRDTLQSKHKLVVKYKLEHDALQAICKALAEALDALIIDDDWGLSIRVDLKLAAQAKAALTQYEAGQNDNI